MVYLKTLALFLFLFIESTSSYADDFLQCDRLIDDTLPKIENSNFTIVNKLVNRDYDPCAKSENPATSKEQMCQKDGAFFQSLLCSKKGQMGFANAGGLFGLPTGICWWHSQFQRNATYLTYYDKSKPKLNPDNKEDKKKIKEIFKNIIRKNKLVEIPGYASLNEFTSDPKIRELLQKRLQGWMAEDSLLKAKWVNGIFVPDNYSKKSDDVYFKQDKWRYDPDSDKLSPKQHKKAIRQFNRATYKTEEDEEKAKQKSIDNQTSEIEELFDIVNRKDKIGYITIQHPGVKAHSQNVFDAKKVITPEGRTTYEFKVQDSNYQGKDDSMNYSDQAYSTIKFNDGRWYMSPSKTQKSLNYDNFNIKVHNNKQFDEINKVYKEACGKELFKD